MRRLALLAALLAAPAARAQDPAAAGFVASDEARVEVLGAPARVGVRIERPEGWYRVEQGGPEDGAVGSFGIVPAAEPAFDEAPAPAAPQAASGGDSPEQLGLGPSDRIPAPRDPRGEGPAFGLEDPCRAERTAYLRALLRTEGVEVADPVGLMEGLEGGGFARGFNWYWLSLRVDPIRPLAWNGELRSLADRLARCATGR